MAEYGNDYIRNRNPENLGQRLKDVGKQSIRGICVLGLYSFHHRARLNPLTGTINGIPTSRPTYFVTRDFLQKTECYNSPRLGQNTSYEMRIIRSCLINRTMVPAADGNGSHSSPTCRHTADLNLDRSETGTPIHSTLELPVYPRFTDALSSAEF